MRSSIESSINGALAARTIDKGGMVSGRVEGKVAFITGAARGQGRAHAVRLAEEGADIIALDVCEQIATVPYAMSTPEDLEQTVKEIETLGRRIIPIRADVRDYVTMKSELDKAVDELGHLDIVVANAGISSGKGPLSGMSEEMWQTVIDINLTGVWHTAKASVPHLRAAEGGSIVLTSSLVGLKGVANVGHYVVAKHGLVGLMRTMALELAPHMIRVNTIHPGNVDTVMIQNPATYALFAPDLEVEDRTRERLAERFQAMSAMPVPWMDVTDISNAVLWLASDESRYVTGVTLPIDAGSLIK
jgi:SDR family mycofactocin-dependent oxidoreductase